MIIAKSNQLERRKIMEVKEHNERLESEIIGWKAKVDDVIRKFDEMPSEDKEKAGPFLRELHMAIKELTARVENLNKEDARQGNLKKTETEGKFNEFRKIWKEIWKHDLPYFRYPHL